MFDFPKNTEWILNSYYEHGRKGYQFEIWERDNISNNIANFKTRTPEAMANKITNLVKKLNKI